MPFTAAGMAWLEKYSHLAPIAMWSLSSPGSTAGSERLFSAAGRAVTPRRPKLERSRAGSLIFGHCNVDRGVEGASQ